MDRKTRDIVISQAWLAISLRRGNGRGVYTEEQFESMQEEPEVQFSQLELLRERLMLTDKKGVLYSNGIAVQESHLEWEDDYAQWEMSESAGEYDVWISREGDSIYWESFLIEGGCFWTKAQAEYKEILPLRGIEDPTIDIRLQTLSDLPIDEDNISSKLSLREWTLDAAAFRIFLERPEYEKTSSFDLSYLKTKGEELSAMLQCGWHAKQIEELHINGIKDLNSDCCVDMNKLQTLTARSVGWKTFEANPKLHTLDLRDNPLVSVALGTELISLGLDTSIPQIRHLKDILHVQVKHLDFSHLPPALHSLSFHNFVGEIDWSVQKELRIARIPFSCGLPLSTHLHTLHIEGGVWSRKDIRSLKIRYPFLRVLSICDADVDEDALLDLGMMTEVTLRRCGLENLVVPSSCQWRSLDLFGNTELSMDRYESLEQLTSLNLSHTSTSISSLVFAGSLMGLQTLGADGLHNVEACCSANALVSLRNLSVRSIDMPVLEFLSKQAFVSLQALDLGDNQALYDVDYVDFMKPKLRVDPHHLQAQELRWLWRQHGHADIFHENPLFFHMMNR